MMTRQDFQIIADEFGYDVRRNGYYLDITNDGTVGTVMSRYDSPESWERANGMTIALNSICAAFARSNPRFDRARFVKAVQTRALLAD